MFFNDLIPMVLKMNEGCGDRAPVQQSQGPEFKPQYHKKKNQNRWRKTHPTAQGL
jgi:hypothetical protein